MQPQYLINAPLNEEVNSPPLKSIHSTSKPNMCEAA
ncbi:hypothetical protein ACVWYU_001004 [Pseudomonas sp. TE12234]